MVFLNSGFQCWYLQPLAIYLFILFYFIQYAKRVTHLAVLAILPCGPLCKIFTYIQIYVA